MGNFDKLQDSAKNAIYRDVTGKSYGKPSFKKYKLSHISSIVKLKNPEYECHKLDLNLNRNSKQTKKPSTHTVLNIMSIFATMFV